MGVTLFGIFVVLHGLVHLFYFGHSRRLFELAPEFVWPDGSWAFSRFLGQEAVRNFAGLLLILAAIGFVTGGIGLFIDQTWWRPFVIGSAAFSTAIFILLWDGAFKMWSEKGGIGILINLALLFTLLVLKWPAFDS